MKDSEQPIRPFATQQAWRTWLEKNQAKSDGIWMRIYKKASGKKTVTYLEAVDEALCFGWIDGQKKTYDAESFLQKFTPRRRKSLWSKTNRNNVARLIKEKRMTATGLAEINAAKKRRPMGQCLRCAERDDGSGGFYQDAEG